MTYDALIFSHSITPRLVYVVDFLSQYYGLSFGITSDEVRYRNATEKVRINYSFHRLNPGEIFIHPHALLSETYIRHVKVECFEKTSGLSQFKVYKAFFRAEGEVGFDLLAAIFYLLSRYEEYLPHHSDSYGRFDHEDSVAWKNDFLNIPLVNIWLKDFRRLLAEKNSQFTTPGSRFSFLPTYDIDMAWSFRNKGVKRNAGGLFSSLLQFKFKRLMYRVRVLRGKIADPFDAYDWMNNLHRSFGLKPIYFFLLGRDRNRYDKNIDSNNPVFQKLVRKIAETDKVALHPSWASGDHPELLAKERRTLEHITRQTINTSRQHFIRFEMPVTFERLLDAGIVNDHSMGYGSINGFRASIATPFFWYDLKKEEKTRLLIHSFCFMDANAYYEQQLDPEEALEEMLRYYQVIRAVEGTMITIWHNSFLGTGEEFRGWKEVYEQFVVTVLTAS